MQFHSTELRALTLVCKDTKLVEMTLPESKVLEKLNAVSTAKRLANMVSRDERAHISGGSSDVISRNCTTRTLGSEKRCSRPSRKR